MKRNQIAAQLYTLRDQMKTPRDIVRGLRRLRELGYSAVQVSGIGPMPAADLRRALDDEGIACCATHEPSDVILEQPQRVVERLGVLGCRTVAYPYPGGVRLAHAGDVAAFAKKLEGAGRALAEAGITLCYHNHQIEFRRVEGVTILERLFAATNPQWLQAELDTHWVQVGGGDPVEWCRRLTGRLPTLHLKDYAINAANEVVFAEVGNGNLNWPAIIQAADKAGCTWFVVEQDRCPGDPFESLRQSLAYIQEHLCSG